MEEGRASESSDLIEGSGEEARESKESNDSKEESSKRAGEAGEEDEGEEAVEEVSEGRVESEWDKDKLEAELGAALADEIIESKRIDES